jgi:hypothetical protein
MGGLLICTVVALVVGLLVWWRLEVAGVVPEELRWRGKAQ